MCRPATCKTCGKTTWGRLLPARRPGHSRPPPRRPLPRPHQGPQLLRRLVPDPPVQPQLMTGSLLGVNRGRNTSPVMPSITARTDRGCTSRPTLVRSVNTGATHTCRRCRTDLCSVTHDPLCEQGPGPQQKRPSTYRPRLSIVSAELPIRGGCIEDDQPHPAETQDPGLLIMRLVLA